MTGHSLVINWRNHRNVRIATFNVENLFSRPLALSYEDWDVGKPILEDYGRFNLITSSPHYSANDKAELLAIMNRNGLNSAHARSEHFFLRDIRGDFARYKDGMAVEILANGRADWIGWLELRRVQINAAAIRNTARVIVDVNPDVLIVVEVEDRATLQRFYDQLVWPQLESEGHARHQIIMLVDANDARGIDIGVISRYPLVGMRSNVHRVSRYGGPLFPRDAIEFYVDVGKKNFVAMIGNHFSSKASDLRGRRRSEQAAEVARIVADLRKRTPWIVVAGDLNDHPAGGSLGPLLDSAGLTDAMALPIYSGRPGTYRTGSATMKLDYLLLSAALRKRASAVDVNRKGYFSTLWEPYEDIKNASPANRSLLQASDHHCVWAELDLK